MKHSGKSVQLLVAALLLLTTGVGGNWQSQPALKPYKAPPGAKAAGKEYSVKLALLYKFGIYITSQKSPYPNRIVLGVYGRNVFGKDLAALDREMPGGKRCVPVHFKTLKDVHDCDILFIPAGTPANEVTSLLAKFPNESMVIVSEDRATFSQSTTINFVVRGSVLMQLLTPEAKRRKLQITPRLLKLMIPVDKPPKVAARPAKPAK